MIIEIPNPLFQPRRVIDVEYQIQVSKVDDEVFKFPDFDEWLSYKAAELGTGDHTEYYSDGDDDYLVGFTVTITTLSMSEWKNKLN